MILNRNTALVVVLKQADKTLFDIFIVREMVVDAHFYRFSLMSNQVISSSYAEVLLGGRQDCALSPRAETCEGDPLACDL